MNWIKRLLHNDSNIFDLTIPEETESKVVAQVPAFETSAPDEEIPMVRPSHPFAPVIIAIGGGKGGVGKSIVSSTLGVLFAGQGEKVLLVDTDLGAANLHTFLGSANGERSLADFFKDKSPAIEECISKTSIPGLDIVNGAQDAHRDAADLDGARIGELQRALRSTDYDYVLLDVGPGTASNILSIFMMADEGIVVTTPEPTSIENSYRFLNCLLLHRLKKNIAVQKNEEFRSLLRRVFEGRNGEGARTIAALMARVREIDERQGKALEAAMGKTSLAIVVNQVKRSGDREIGPLMQRACYDFFGVKVSHLATIDYEDCVVDSIRARKPLGIHHRESQTVRILEGVTKSLIQKRRERV